MQPLYSRLMTSFRYRTLLSNLIRPRQVSALRSPVEFPSALLSSIVTSGLTCHGESGKRYRLVHPLGSRIHSQNSSNVWLAVDDSNTNIEYILKGPPEDAHKGLLSNALFAFKHELEMQRLFAKDPMIRTLLDYIPDSKPDGPMIVLEAFTDSLWEARHARQFTKAEVKWIMKGILLGIFTVHMKGLVYTGKSEAIGKQRV